VTRLYGLSPIADGEARVLILGSFPSAASLAVQQYYAHRQNQFWRILSAVLGTPLVAAEYSARQSAVKAAGLAIWDVFASCERDGSLDSAIRDARENDFDLLLAKAPALRRVCFNGQAAGRFASRISASGLETRVLPSTSPANATWSFERKLAAWREALVI